MARTLISPLSVSRTALRATGTPPAVDVSNGNYCPNDGFTYLEVTNADGAATHVLTVQVVSGIDGLTTGPRTYTVPISAVVQKVGPYPLQFYGNTLLFSGDSAQLKVQPYSLLGP